MGHSHSPPQEVQDESFNETLVKLGIVSQGRVVDEKEGRDDCHFGPATGTGRQRQSAEKEEHEYENTNTNHPVILVGSFLHRSQTARVQL